MAKILTSFRKTSLMPIMAAATSFLLVAGQVFNCCRLNESISESIGKAALAVTHMVSHPDVNRENQSVKTHLGCHGHSPSDESLLNADLPGESGSQVNAKESCLSESGSALKALTLPDAFQTTFFTGTTALVQEAPVPLLSCFEKPRPQNKSSPPIYLLTLRILV